MRSCYHHTMDLGLDRRSGAGIACAPLALIAMSSACHPPARCPPAAPAPAPAEATTATTANPAPAGDAGTTAAADRPCRDSAVHHQFDFWLGAWEVTVPSGKVAGHNRIETVASGCALLESWHSASGGAGNSLNYVDPASGDWVQVWAGGDAGEIVLRGGLHDGAMILSGTLVEPGDKHSLLRGTWTPQPDGRVRQLFEQSTDDGATWTTWFDGTYSPMGSLSGVSTH